MRLKQFAPRVALITIAVLFAVTFFGCGGGGGPGGGGGRTVVRGIVRNSTNSDEPVEGARVTIGGVSAVTRTVDNASSENPVGSFEIVNPAVGARVATIEIGNPVTDTQQVGFEPPIVSGTNDDLELFINIGQLTGRVLLPGGQPATNARVTVAATGETRQVNSDGTFLVQLIPLGSTQLFAVQGTATATQTYTITPGLQNVGDIQLADDPNPNPPGQPRTIFGTITLQGAGNVAGVSVLLFRNGTQIESTFTDAQGKYSFLVPAGNYSLRVISTGFQDGTANITLTDPNVPQEVNLTLTP